MLVLILNLYGWAAPLNDGVGFQLRSAQCIKKNYTNK